MKLENNIKLKTDMKLISKYIFLRSRLLRILFFTVIFIAGYNTIQAQEYVYIYNGSNYLAVNSSNAITNVTSNTSKYAIWVKIPVTSGSTNYYLYNFASGRYLYGSASANTLSLATVDDGTSVYQWTTSGTNIYNTGSTTRYIRYTGSAWEAGTTTSNRAVFGTVSATAINHIVHKEGSFYSGLLSNNMQKTHIINKTVYCQTTAQNVLLKIPPQRGGNNAAPHGYFRWYMYDTDSLSDPTIINTNVHSERVSSNGKFYISNNTIAGQQAYYNYSRGGSGKVVCDVSSYSDYNSSVSNSFTEPSLSYRCIFTIKPASEIAQELKDSTDKGSYLEEKTVYMPKTPADTHEPIRVSLDLDRSNYFGYDGAGAINSLSFSSPSSSSTDLTLSTTTSIYTTANRFIFISRNSSSSITQATVILQGTSGSGANLKTYNIARFKIIFTSDSPKTFSSINSSESRSLTYLDDNFVQVSKLDFDYNTEVANSGNNMYSYPLSYDICSYGFTSPDLISSGYKPSVTNNVAQWNEYGFYKTANVIKTNYTWYNGGYTVYDRLYDLSSGSKSGYFMYIDAAEDPGVIATLPIDPLCPGTNLYVSASIASLTGSGSSSSYPNFNLVFLGVDAYGNETELNRYTSGDIPPTTSSPTPWYQLYYSFTFSNSDVGYTSYKIRFENNCTSTSGGDYAVDDIRIYRSKPTVQANQITLPCGTDNAKIKIRVEYSKLLSSLGITEVTSGSGSLFDLKYKFLDNNKINLTNYNYGTTASPSNDYGTIMISDKFSDMNVLASGAEAPIADRTIKEAYTESETIDGVLYRYIVFQTPNNEVLMPNKEYYTVIANNAGVFGTDMCSMISDPFVIIPPAVITVDGATWTEDQGLCYGNQITLGAMLKDKISYENIACRFDWFIGSSTEYQSTSGGMSVEEAIKAYRVEYPNPTSGDYTLHPATGLFTTTAYNLLNSLITAKKLLLNRSQITRIIRQGENFIAYPIIATAVPTPETSVLRLCSDYIPLGGTQTPKNPTIEWADGSMGSISVRMGLDQFNDLKNNATKTLKIPVKDFNNSDQTKLRNLTKASDTNVYLINTDDPDYVVDSLAPVTQIATLNTINVTTSSSDEDYVMLNNIRTITAKEGYTYKMEFKFNQVNLDGEISACDGVTSLYVKIVPKYLTWKGNSGDNWNNDNNWVRSSQSELYKNASHNSDSYTDYVSPLVHKGFVPMNFSNVTIPAVNGATVQKSPWLYNLSGSPVNTDNTNYSAAADKSANAATSGIANDVCAKSSGVNYDCENFYGNTVNKIYFKPLAEMRNTNYLTYNEASVEFELTSGKWYMMTSPLKDVVAGDMYTLTANGQQDTEAFGSITYNPATNNRFNPAIYQHSWDKADSKVFKTDHTSTDAYIASNWSYVYNEVSEPYSPGTGFAIKPVFGTPGVSKLLFRLPKNDASYSYYSYNGSTTGDNTTISRTNNGRLAFENADTEVSVNITNQAGTNDIFLAGNPMMASLDMKSFFDQNSSFERKFWIITTNGLSAAQIAADGSIITSGADVLSRNIAPMQAFFVERTDGSNTSSITFKPNMNVAASASSQLRSVENENNNISKLIVTAKGNDFSSNTVIVKKDYATNGYDSEEDVVLLYDQNLYENPAIFTLSGNKAVMINTISNIDSIPLGVISKTNQEVELLFSGLESFSKDNIYLYDKVLNRSIILNSSNSKIKIMTNSYGRYSLVSDKKSTLENNSDKDILVFSNGKGKISVNSSDNKIDRIKVYNLSGILIKDINEINNSNIEISLNERSLYLVKIICGDKIENHKVYCK